VVVDTAEMVVVTPDGAGRFVVRGRLTAHTPLKEGTR
jgi:hypothetical protein